jgi:aspartate carbamoyltransferase catalytic subunit
MSRYSGIKFVLISPEELKLPGYVKYEFLGDGKIAYEEIDDLEKAMPQLDILYMTRVQQERFSSYDEYLRLKDSYILTPDKLVNAKSDLCIMHPLPRVNEISVKIDEDPRACYFEQAANGRFIRMALILKLLNEKDQPDTPRTGESVEGLSCENPRCICKTEQELAPLFRCADEAHGVYRCVYCDQKAYRKKK